jgi:hypothetical protein
LVLHLWVGFDLLSDLLLLLSWLRINSLVSAPNLCDVLLQLILPPHLWSASSSISIYSRFGIKDILQDHLLPSSSHIQPI